MQEGSELMADSSQRLWVAFRPSEKQSAFDGRQDQRGELPGLWHWDPSSIDGFGEGGVPAGEHRSARVREHF
jgi:hypothetical protein